MSSAAWRSGGPSLATADSAHGIFNSSPQIWGPSVMEFFARYGVVP